MGEPANLITHEPTRTGAASAKVEAVSGNVTRDDALMATAVVTRWPVRSLAEFMRATARVVMLGFAFGMSSTGFAEPVGDALQRSALMVKAPQRAVLLSAALAGDRVVAVGERGVVVLSDDAGVSWRQVPCPVSVTLTMVRFASDAQGVAVGHGGVVLTTDDGGAHWVLRLDGRRAAKLMHDSAKTPEARSEAERLIADGADKPFLEILLWDAKRLLVLGAYGLALHSEDGGHSWTSWADRLPNPKALHWYAARRQGSTLILAGEQGLLVRSDDGGESFHHFNSPYAGSWFAADLASNGDVVVAGLRGNVWRYSASSGNWQRVFSPVTSTITSIANSPDGALLLTSQAGLVLQLSGDVLQPLNAQPMAMPAAILPLRDGKSLVVGMGGVTLVRPNAREVRP